MKNILSTAKGGRKKSPLLSVMLATAVLVFGLFYLIGFDRRYAENANFNDPLFTWLVIGFALLLVVAAVGVVVWSVVMSLRHGVFASAEDNGVPVRKITITVFCGMLLLLLVTFVLGSSAPLVINGRTYSEIVWLKLADMFTISSAVLIAVATGVLIYSSVKKHV